MKDIAAVNYDVSASSVEGQFCIESAKTFDEILLSLKQAIFEADLWLIQELDPQTVMLRGGRAIGRMRQLLFFHPRYLEPLLATDSSALPEVPMKIVVLEKKDGGVVVRAPDPQFRYRRHEKLKAFGAELSGVVKTILDSAC